MARKKSKQELERNEAQLAWLVREEFGEDVRPGAVELLDSGDRDELLVMLATIEAATQLRSAPAMLMPEGAIEFIARVELAGGSSRSTRVQRDVALLTEYTRRERRVPTRAEMKVVSNGVKSGKGTDEIFWDLHALQPEQRAGALTVAVLKEEDRMRFEMLVERLCGLEEGHFAGRRDLAKMSREIAEASDKPVMIPAKVFRALSRNQLTIGDVSTLTLILGRFATQEAGEEARFEGDTLVVRGSLWPKGWKVGVETVIFPTGGDQRHPLHRLSRAGWLEVTWDASGIWRIRKGPALDGAPAKSARLPVQGPRGAGFYHSPRVRDAAEVTLS